MQVHKLDLNLLAVFEALMEERSVTRAAARLGIGQPAASAALARLRRLFDDELLIRGPSGMTPTERAIQALGPISSALEEMRRAVGAGKPFDPATAEREFHVSGGDYAAMVLLPALYERIRAEAPGVDLRFRSLEKETVRALLETGEIDLAIGTQGPVPKSLVSETLIEERFVCLTRRTHPGLRDGVLTLAAYTQWPHVVVTDQGDGDAVVDERLRREGRSRRIVLSVPHALAVPALVAASDTIATIGERVARRCCVVSSALIIHEPPLHLAPWTLAQVWARRRSGDDGLVWLRRALAAAAEEKGRLPVQVLKPEPRALRG